MCLHRQDYCKELCRDATAHPLLKTVTAEVISSITTRHGESKHFHLFISWPSLVVLLSNSWYGWRKWDKVLWCNAYVSSHPHLTFLPEVPFTMWFSPAMQYLTEEEGILHRGLYWMLIMRNSGRTCSKRENSHKAGFELSLEREAEPASDTELCTSCAPTAYTGRMWYSDGSDSTARMA